VGKNVVCIAKGLPDYQPSLREWSRAINESEARFAPGYDE
jgi:hypothetical protein